MRALLSIRATYTFQHDSFNHQWSLREEGKEMRGGKGAIEDVWKRSLPGGEQGTVLLEIKAT